MAAATAPLIEREPALAAAEQAIADARGGDGSVVFFAGGAGAGKTHLLDAIHSAARGTVLRACGHVSETALAYGLVRQLFDDFLDELSPLERERLFEGPAGAALPLLGRGGPPGGGVVDPDLAARHGVWRLLQAIARSRGPVVALVDDLQWADPESALALAYCANRVGGAPIALLCAGRDRELPAPAAAILDAAAPHPLAALSEAVCARLVEELMPGALAAFAGNGPH